MTSLSLSATGSSSPVADNPSESHGETCRHSAGGRRCELPLRPSATFEGYLIHAIAPLSPHYPIPFRVGEPDPDRYMRKLRALRVEVAE